MASVARFHSLQNIGGQVTQQVLSQIPSPPKHGAAGISKKRVAVYTKTKHIAENRESDGKCKIDTERYRNSYMHNLCLDMLKDGFHYSFCELFNLMKSEREERQKLEPESGLQNEPLVQDQPEKLEQLRLNLTSAEAAKRRGKMDTVYGCYLSLADYFDQSGDTFLANHFYQLCLETSVKVRGDGRRKEAEANLNMGVTYEKQGNFVEALRCFENIYALTNGRLWQVDGSEKTLFSTACECLQRVYITVAMQLKESDLGESLAYLLKAYKTAKEGDDIIRRGEASYILGCAYQDNENPETALLYHNEYFNICQEVKDLNGMGRACRALAKAYEQQMDVESAVKYLETFVELTEKSGDWKEQQTACSSLGEILNALGKYEEAATYFEKAYKLTKKMDEKQDKELVRAEYGVVRANLVIRGITQTMNTVEVENISKLLTWKQLRKDVFTHEPSVACSSHESKTSSGNDASKEIVCANLARNAPQDGHEI